MLQMRYGAEGVPEAASRLGIRAKELVKQRAALVKKESKRLIGFVRREAPRDTGVFAEGIKGWSIGTPPDMSLTEVVATGEHAFLLDYIVKGTPDHDIPKGGSAVQMAKGYPLGFWWEKGPAGPGKYHFWSVHHPGTKPNDFVKRGRVKWQPWATRRFRKLGMFIRRAERTP